MDDYRVRSGRLLLPEHWAILREYDEIFKYLRATRLRQEGKNCAQVESVLHVELVRIEIVSYLLLVD